MIKDLPSERKPRLEGEKRLYDIYGGEWRAHTKDKGHNLHWDYKSEGKATRWLNIPINGKKPKIIKKYLKYMEENKLYVRCFDDFSGRPQILIDGNAEDYLHAANYLSGRKSALLNDANCFRYLPPLIDFRDEWLVINSKECGELADLFANIARDSGCYHHYYELESLEDTPIDIKISIGEYGKEFMENG